MFAVRIVARNRCKSFQSQVGRPGEFETMTGLGIRFTSVVGLLLLAAVSWALCPDSAFAQAQRGKRGGQTQAKPPVDPITGTGIVQAWTMDKGGTIALKVKLGDLDWTLKTTKTSKLRVVGTADFEFIKPGMYIQTLALLDKKKGTVLREVPKVTIITPTERPKDTSKGGRAAGAAGGGGGGARPADDFELGCFPDESGVNQFAPPENPEAQFFTIRGQVSSMGKDRTMVVTAPVNGRPMRFNIKPAENVEIDFNIEFKAETQQVVKFGEDEFTLTRGNRDVPNQNVGTLNDATIKHLEPLTGAAMSKKKPDGKKPEEKKPEEKKPDEK